jgi:hypothetical protein
MNLAWSNVVSSSWSNAHSPVQGASDQNNTILVLIWCQVWCHNGTMELTEHIESIRRQFAAAAEAGGVAAKAQAEMLFAPLESAIRLALQDVLVAAAEEITCELAPGSVELRLRGREPEFVVNLPQPDPPSEPEEVRVFSLASPEGDEGATARINLRLPEHLKARVDEAAASEGLSINTWLVRAMSAALERSGPARGQDRRPATGSQRYTGWSR